MDTTTLKERNDLLKEEAVFEDDMDSQDPGMTDEELKIESLKIATNIAKLMSNVTPDDIINIAETVATFIKNGNTTLEAVPEESENSADNEEDFETDNKETEENTEGEETTEENTEDTSEDFEV